MSARPDLTGKTCILTGANSGIGKATALELAKMGAKLVMVCRDREKGEAAEKEIIAESKSNNIELMVADLSCQESIRKFATDFQKTHERLDLLINNAGVYLTKRQTTPDGLEATFATNLLGPFLLTNLLLGVLKAGAPSRVVNVSSDAHKGIMMNFEDLQGEKKFSSWQAYGQSKLGMILFTHELSKRLAGTGITVNSVHPGVVRTHFAKNNGGLVALGFRIIGVFFISPSTSAKRVLYVATSPDLINVSGRYFSKMREERSSRESYDDSSAEHLWEISERLTGLSGQI